MLRSLVSAVPVAGGLLTEIVSVLIPNQRIDRVERFLLALADELYKSGNSQNLPTADGPKLELVESGIRAASEIHSLSKTVQLAKCVSKGLSSDEAAALRAQRVLRIISELDPEEMIVLLSYTKRSISDAEEFQEKYPSIFDVPSLYIGADQETRKRNAEYQAAERHLIALGLLSEEIRFDRDTDVVERFGSEIRKDVELTMIGRLVLFYAGLAEEL